MTQLVLPIVLTLTLGVLASACTGQVPAQSPTSPSATLQPPAIPVTGPTLSGQVYEVTSEGLRAVPQGTVWYSVDGGRVSNGGRSNIVNIDSSGRYTISALSTGSRIRLTASSGAFQQTCAVYTVFGQAIPFRTSSWCGRVRTTRHVMARCCPAWCFGSLREKASPEGSASRVLQRRSRSLGRLREHRRRGPFRILWPSTRSRIAVGR